MTHKRRAGNVGIHKVKRRVKNIITMEYLAPIELAARIVATLVQHKNGSR
jgi:hypothetical protein